MSAKRVSIDKKRSLRDQSKSPIEPKGTEILYEPEPINTEEKKDLRKLEKMGVEDKQGLVKTTVYIEEDNFLALEDIQLKLKRQERRRVTKNELFNKAIELLRAHYL